jgi:hypothetical protein
MIGMRRTTGRGSTTREASAGGRRLQPLRLPSRALCLQRPIIEFAFVIQDNRAALSHYLLSFICVRWERWRRRFEAVRGRCGASIYAHPHAYRRTLEITRNL